LYGLNKIFNFQFRTMHLNGDTGCGIGNIPGQGPVCGKPVDQGPEADTLDGAGDSDEGPD
jgi:hypothetical protein